MSGSIGLSTTPLTDAEKADLRRFMGYPSYGSGASGFQGWRFFTAYGTMEFRFNNSAPAELQVMREYLATLYPLETAIPTAGTNIGTDQAAVWFRNKNEQRDRERLFDSTRRRLCGFMGLPPGPALGNGGIQVIV